MPEIKLRTLKKVSTDEKKSWFLHDIVQGISLLTVAGMMISGIVFVTNIKEDSAVQRSIQNEHSRRIAYVETHQLKTDTKLENSIKELRREQGEKLDKLDTKLDRLIERSIK